MEKFGAGHKKELEVCRVAFPECKPHMVYTKF